MKNKLPNLLMALRRTEAFLEAHHDLLSAVNGSGTREVFDEHIARIRVYQVEKQKASIATQRLTEQLREQRRALLIDHMRPIARVAAMHLPHSAHIGVMTVTKKGLRVEALRAAALCMAKGAAAHRRVFIAAGRPADFVARLIAAANGISDASDARQRARDELRSATVSLWDQVRRARKAAWVLDAFVREKVKSPELLGAWDAARALRSANSARSASSARSARSRGRCARGSRVDRAGGGSL